MEVLKEKVLSKQTQTFKLCLMSKVWSKDSGWILNLKEFPSFIRNTVEDKL